MSGKIKILLTALAMIAIVSVFSFSKTFSSIKSSLLIPENFKAALLKIESDEDGDGLLNADESYWGTDFRNPDTDGDGFVDGEEVASGHDPKRPGPDDLLIQNQNLTEKFSTLALAGLYEGSLAEESQSYHSSIDQIALTILDDALAEFNPRMDASKLKTIESTMSNQQEYLKKIGSIVVRTANFFALELKDTPGKLALIEKQGLKEPSLASYYKSRAAEFHILLNEMLAMEVPKNWQNEHVSLLSFLNELTSINNVLSTSLQDPIKAMVGINRFIGLMEEIGDIINSYNSKMEAEKIDFKNF